MMEWDEKMIEEIRSNKGHSAQNSISSIRRVSLVIPPLPPAKDEGYRPATSSTRRFSFATTVSSSQRTIKYGKGKHARTELSPQPSDDLGDPLVCQEHQALAEKEPQPEC